MRELLEGLPERFAINALGHSYRGFFVSAIVGSKSNFILVKRYLGVQIAAAPRSSGCIYQLAPSYSCGGEFLQSNVSLQPSSAIQAVSISRVFAKC